ncbi:hypothetical protein KF707_00575 [Candidatus Obscuribacterales bacterium]|nr:hypothetical protein [Candidatus Obscuribacterales bacterium]MBX3150165.1 hypothetical protein [Candidatus Obscuribacterales bacterium]
MPRLEAQTQELQTKSYADSQADGALRNLQLEANAYYQCGPGGPIVTNKQECYDLKFGNLPELEIVDNNRAQA